MSAAKKKAAPKKAAKKKSAPKKAAPTKVAEVSPASVTTLEAGADIHGVMAVFETPADAMHAAESVRDAGYKRWDVHTPFPVHGMDKAMGMRDSSVGWIVLAMGLTGCLTAFLLMWWTNGHDYPLVVGGKPGFSLPSMVPVMFELTVLLSA